MSRRLDFLELGLTDFCQNRCVMCHQSRDWFLPKGRAFLDTELALRLAAELRREAFDVNALYLFWIGEPLLHPDAATILRAFFTPAPACRGFTLNTNGERLEGECLDACLDAAERAEFAHVILSLDSTRPETYARIRVGGDHARVMANLRALLARRRAGKPRIIPQMVVMEENADEIDTFVADLRALGAPRGISFPVIGERRALAGDAIYLRPLLFEEAWLADPAGRARHAASIAAWRAALSRHAPGSDPEAILRRESADPRERPAGVCRAPFAGAVVTCRGLVVPCCGDYFEELPLGDLGRESFASIWEGPAARALRAAHLSGDPANLPARCRRCHLPAEGRMAPGEAAERAAACGMVEGQGSESDAR